MGPVFVHLCTEDTVCSFSVLIVDLNKTHFLCTLAQDNPLHLCTGQYVLQVEVGDKGRCACSQSKELTTQTASVHDVSNAYPAHI